MINLQIKTINSLRLEIGKGHHIFLLGVFDVLATHTSTLGTTKSPKLSTFAIIFHAVTLFAITSFFMSLFLALNIPYNHRSECFWILSFNISKFFLSLFITWLIFASITVAVFAIISFPETFAIKL